MKTVQLESEVGPDGVLSLHVPLGTSEAHTRVIVTIAPLRETNGSEGSDWHEFVERTYGSCAGLGLEEPQDLPLQQPDWGQ